MRSYSTIKDEEEFRIPDVILEPFEVDDFVGVEEDMEEGLLRASNVDSYDEIANPLFIQSAVLAKTEESSKNEWALKLEKLKRNATCDSLASYAKVGL